jgi:Ser/Thr protein kinase RdoA (MazF antagonist)
MQTMRHLREDLDLANHFIQQWDLKDLESLVFFRSSASSIYQVKANQEIYYLRLIPFDERPLTHLRDEMKVIQWLLKHQMDIIEPVLSKGKTYIIEDHNHYGSLFKAVKGLRLDQMDLNDDLVILMGKQLAKMHALTKDKDTLVKRTIYDLLTEFNTDHPFIQDERDDLINVLFKLDCSFGMIHFDYEPDNLFYDQEAHKINLIDFESTLKSYHMHELYNVFEAWEDEYNFAKDKADFFKDLLIHTYQEFHPNFIYKTEYEPIFKRVNRLVQYIQLSHCLSDIPEDEEPWMEDLAIRYSLYIQQYESMMKEKWS